MALVSAAGIFLSLMLGCPSAESQPFRFTVTCDQRYYCGPGTYDTPSYYRGVCETIDNLGSGAFMISPGDIDPCEDVYWTNQQYLGDTYLWYPVVGNHELPGDGHEDYYGANMDWLRGYNPGGDSLPYVVNIGPTHCEETTFSFDYENAHFVVINEYYDGFSDIGADGDVLDSLYDWLADDLAANTKPLIFISGHEPAYPQPDAYNGRERHVGDSLDKYPSRRDRFWELLSSYGVVAYFCGHTHNYSAVRHRGVWQLDAAHARGAGDTGAPSTFFLVDVAGDSLSDVTVTVHRDLHDGDYDYDDLVHVIDAGHFPHAIDGLMDFDVAEELLDSLASDPTHGGDGQIDRLYFAWNDSTLFVAFEENDFNGAGDFFIYFDCDTGGTRRSTDWHTIHDFPPSFLADQAICVEGGSWQDQRTWNPGAEEWEIAGLGDTECRAYAGWADYPLTEISVPFDEIGYHPADTLKFLVYCQQEEGGDLWISFPPGNATGSCPLIGYYLYDGLVPGAVPNQTVSRILQDWIPPKGVTHPGSSKSGQTLQLNWNPVTLDTAGCEETIAGYVVYRDTAPDFDPGPEDSLGTSVDTSFLDTSAAVGQTSVQHFYIILAVDAGSNVSIPSNAVGEFDRQLNN
jgi:hypothetical protein